MSAANEHLLNEVLLALFHAGYAASAAVLGLILGERHTLDIAVVGERYNTVLLGDKILYIDLAAYVLDICSSLVVELLLDGFEVVFDYLVNSAYIGENILKIGYFGKESVQLISYLLTFKACELSESHLDDSLSLFLGKTRLILNVQTVKVILRTVKESRHINVLEALDHARLCLLNSCA